MPVFALIVMLHINTPLIDWHSLPSQRLDANPLHSFTYLPPCLVLSSITGFFPLMGSVLVNQQGTLSKVSGSWDAATIFYGGLGDYLEVV